MDTTDPTTQTAAERAFAERRAQGLPETAEDPVALDRTAALIEAAERSAAQQAAS